MGSDKQVGFTIIETMLFLGITGLLIATMLVGIGTSINIQRYRDSVTSLQNILQQQYSEVINVDNGERSQNWTCDSSANVTATTGTAPARGQSPNCYLLGRYITTTDDATLALYSVVGYLPPNTTLESDDVAALSQFTINISPLLSDSYSMDWGSTLVAPGGNAPATFSVLIVRSPSSGITRTFINPTQSVAARDLGTLINAQYLQSSSDATLCVNSGSGVLLTAKLAIKIAANAATAEGIQLIGDGSAGC